MTKPDDVITSAILEKYTSFSYCDDIEFEPLSEWLATDMVRLIRLMDAELQQRATDAEQDLHGPDGPFDDFPEEDHW